MHWATPNTSGRMIDLHEQNVKNYEPISLNSSPVNDKGKDNSNYIIINIYKHYLQIFPELLFLLL